MDADFEAYLQVGEVTFDGADAALLRAIDDEGSLNAAADTLERSYSRAHKRLTELEDTLGPLVERERGGSGGGGSVLTDNAREMLAQFARLQAVLGGTATAEEIVIPGAVSERSGELLTVDTEAGPVRAIAAGFDRVDSGTFESTGQRVEVTLTADSVTLHDVESAPDGAQTSARNRLTGTVQSVDQHNAIATVTVDIGTATPLVVLVTAESQNRLGLTAGKRVAATFKATAARATPLDD